jgi:cytochrome c oxidase assembly protein subunit 11
MSNVIKQIIPKSQLTKICLIPIFMFGFGFAMVPLYNVFCDITGLNGKTGRVEASTIDEDMVDRSRSIEVRFLANTGRGLQWSFEPLVKKMEVHPGQLYEAMYRVRSTTDKPTKGQAVPSVSPGLAAQHFNKTECFCFTQQNLAGFESKLMPIKFIIGRDVSEKIEQITLSYTFFNIEQG